MEEIEEIEELEEGEDNITTQTVKDSANQWPDRFGERYKMSRCYFVGRSAIAENVEKYAREKKSG